MYNKGMMFGGLKQLSEKMTAHVTALTHVREYCGRPYCLHNCEYQQNFKKISVLLKAS